MKKFKLYALLTLIIIPIISVLIYLSPISIASSFTYQYNPSVNNWPPFVANIDGRNQTVYCSEHGAEIIFNGACPLITYNSGATYNMSPGLAYAFSQCISANSRQNLIWMSEISYNLTPPNLSERPDYNDALLQSYKIAPFNDYYNNLQRYGSTVKFENTGASLQSSDNGQFTLGPFKLDFYKSDFSRISGMYLQTNDGRQINISQVSFGGYIGSPSDIDSGEEFYVMCSQQDTGTASTVKLVVNYSYETASGSYTYYEPSPVSYNGWSIQRMVTLDYNHGGSNATAVGPEIELVFDLKGKVFKDVPATKYGAENGILDQMDIMLPGIEVTLFDSNGNQVNQKTTDSNGYYEFLRLPASKKYYVRFKYNGQLYEPTTYQRVSKVLDNYGTLGATSVAERSYATDGRQNRTDFNAKFTPVDATHKVPDRNDESNPAFDIYSYTGPNGMEELKYYGISNSKEELSNVNFGIKEREKFDMNLRKDLVKVDVSINGKSHTYQYNGDNQDLEVKIRGTDLPDYERAFRSSDLLYKQAQQYDQDKDKLQVLVTYKIQLKNQSQGKITGYVIDLNDFYDSSYEFVRSYDENNNEIQWSQANDVSGNGKTYHAMHTTALAQEGITDKKWVFLEYKVTNDALRALINEKESTKENFAEIAGYRNTYTEDKKDLNGQVLANAGDIAGLIDIDSTPANMNPTDSDVQSFVAQSKTQEYQYLDGETKSKMSSAVFEDDADCAPGLKLIVDDLNRRKLSGSVFEDAALTDRLENDNERIGDGVYSDGENLVNQVRVQLICTNPDVEVKEARTNTDGSYEFTDYIPGDYSVKFIYGDYESLKAVQPENKMYTGQDFKNTLYTEGNYTDVYWYNNNVDTRNNDAKDNYDRRLEVNSYSENLQYNNATVLNASASSDDATLHTLADNTYMFADTAQMSFEVEYLKQEKTNYSVRNIDLGLIERPRTKIVLKKNVSYVKLTATDGSTIFDATAEQGVSKEAPNLSWVENGYDEKGNMTSQGMVQGIVDENLMHGASLTVAYSFSVTNESEKDYNEQSYYYTGNVADYGTANKLSAETIIDYIPNALTYDAELTKNSGTYSYGSHDEAAGTAKSFETSIAGSNTYWTVLASKVDSIAIPEEYRGNLLAPEVYDNVQASTNEILTNNRLSGSLGIGDETTLGDALICTRVLSSPDESTSDDDMTNIAEIIQVHIDNGRRPYYINTTDDKVIEIPGNADPTTSTNLEEADTGLSEILTFVVPFGANKQLTIIAITIVGLAVIVGGIVLIKKKVL